MFSKNSVIPIYIATFLLGMHYALIAYVNSSLLISFTSSHILNILFAAGSVLSIFSLYIAPPLFRKYGSIILTLIYIVLEILSVYLLGNVQVGLLIAILFLIHQSGESFLIFSLDVQLESKIKKENTTGYTRGLYLTISNLAWVLSPLIVSLITKGNSFSNVYTLSSFILIPLFLITSIYFNNIKETSSYKSNIFLAIKRIINDGDEKRIIFCQFILQFFFSWMVIYMPILLNTIIGFSWKEIGIMFTIMLLPFLIFQLPIGRLADKKWGEKELLYIGFSIIAIFTSVIPFIHQKIFILWTIILFMTRVGASIVEIASESYFFKHVEESDTALISLFRITRPLSLVLAPLIAIPIISTFSYSGSFIFLGVCTLIGIIFVPKKDTL